MTPVTRDVDEAIRRARERFRAWVETLPRVEDGVEDNVEVRLAAQRRVLAALPSEEDREALLFFSICLLDHLIALRILPGGPVVALPPNGVDAEFDDCPGGTYLSPEQIAAFAGKRGDPS